MSSNALFKHRLDATKIHDAFEVQEAFNVMAFQAKGILNSLSIQFEKQSARIDAESMMDCINAVDFAIDDMKCIINAHFDLSRNKDGQS